MEKDLIKEAWKRFIKNRLITRSLMEMNDMIENHVLTIPEIFQYSWEYKNVCHLARTENQPLGICPVCNQGLLRVNTKETIGCSKCPYLLKESRVNKVAE